VLFFVTNQLFFPRGFCGEAFVARIPHSTDVFRHLEGGVGPAELGTGCSNFRIAQRRAMHIVRPLLVGRTETDHRLARNKRRALRVRLRSLDGSGNLRGIVTVGGQHLPAIGFEALRRIVGEPAFHLAIDGDAVVIIEHDQLAKPESAGQ